MAAPELAFAEELRDLLNSHGSARLEYITAEFQPFSNQQRPDIVFAPRHGGFVGQPIFIEVKLSTKPIRDGHGLRILVDHKEFATDALETNIARYVYVSNVEIPEFSKKFLAENSIAVIDRVSMPSEVVSGLRALGILP